MRRQSRVGEQEQHKKNGKSKHRGYYWNDECSLNSVDCTEATVLGDGAGSGIVVEVSSGGDTKEQDAH